MCIIVVKPAGHEISEDQLKHMWTENPHGAGFMYAFNGKLKVVKGLMTFPDFLNSYISHGGTQRKMVIHFRWRTHGTSDPKMTHPFWIGSNNLAMAHNGVIGSAAKEATAHKSDTYIFAEKLAESYDNVLKAIQHPFHKEMIESYVGRGNKLVFMDNTGEVHILNEEAGHWEGDVWYSNTGFRPTTRRFVPSGNYTVIGESGIQSVDFNSWISKYEQKKLDKKARREEAKQRKLEAKQEELFHKNYPSKAWYEYFEDEEERAEVMQFSPGTFKEK